MAILRHVAMSSSSGAFVTILGIVSRIRPGVWQKLDRLVEGIPDTSGHPGGCAGGLCLGTGPHGDSLAAHQALCASDSGH